MSDETFFIHLDGGRKLPVPFVRIESPTEMMVGHHIFRYSSNLHSTGVLTSEHVLYCTIPGKISVEAMRAFCVGKAVGAMLGHEKGRQSLREEFRRLFEIPEPPNKLR